MRKLVILVALSMACPAWATPIPKVLEAIRQVESSGRTNPPDGDDGASIGPYQIQRKYWIDSRVPGDYQDCRDRAYAERVILAYWRRYCPKAMKAGKAEVLARVHNGGPAGARKAETIRYWRLVREALASAE